MYKNYRIILIFLMAISSCKASPPTNTCNSKNDLKIEYVGQFITTMFQVSCNSFSNTFKDDIDTIKIDKKNGVCEFDSLFLLNNNITISNGIDVRIKIIYTHGKVIDTMCTDGSGIFFMQRGNKYFKNKLLKDFINKKIGWQ